MFIKKTASQHENVHLSKKILFIVLSHDLHWENKIDKRAKGLLPRILIVIELMFAGINEKYLHG